MAHLAEMVQRRLHFDDRLEDVRRLARFLQEPHGDFANLIRRVVQLCEEKPERPGIGSRTCSDERTQMVRGE